MTFDTNTLRPADVLLYKGSGFFSRVIQIKTWHPISHVEVSIGPEESVASRDGIGVGRYPRRDADLAHVLRPLLPFDLAAAMRYFARMNGTAYGWLDLLAFVGVNYDANGIVCSPFATEFLRAGGVRVFNTEPAREIAPFQFLTSELLVPIWSADRAQEPV